VKQWEASLLNGARFGVSCRLPSVQYPRYGRSSVSFWLRRSPAGRALRPSAVALLQSTGSTAQRPDESEPRLRKQLSGERAGVAMVVDLC
jgi:hypothetical protein